MRARYIFEARFFRTSTSISTASPWIVVPACQPYLSTLYTGTIEKMHFSSISVVALLAAATSASQTVYLIRHGEKPADGGNGLNIQGEQRAQCLRNVFGSQSQYNIGYIIAEQPKSS